MKRVWSWVIVSIIFLLMIGFFMRNKNILEILKSIRLEYFIILFALSFLTIFLNGFQLKYIIKMYGKELKVKEWLGLNIVSFMADYITPFKGGLSVKVVYLKKVHGIPYTRIATIIGATIILSLLITSLFGIVISLAYNLGVLTLGVFCVSFFVTGFMIFLSPSLSATKNEKINYLIRSVNELKNLRKNFKVITILFFIKICSLLIITLKIYYSFKTLSYNLPLNHSLVIGLFSAISLIVNITPANLGVREAIITFSAETLGVSSELGLSAAIIDRVVTVIFLFTTGPIFSYILSQQKIKQAKA